MASAADLRTALVAALVTTLLATGLAAPAPADAAYSTTICVSRAAVRQSPGGYSIGFLFRRDRVRVSRRSANRRWARITTPTELRGWVTTRSLCR